MKRLDRIALDFSRRGWSGGSITKVLAGNFTRDPGRFGEADL
jgi:hypothetical protein